MTEREQTAAQQRVETIIFGTNTHAGRLFDVILLAVIVTSVGVVMLDSIIDFHARFGRILQRVELFFTFAFSIEYLVRIWCVKHRRVYLSSFWGIVDFLSLVPTYLALVIPDAAPLLVIRLLRVMRIFRVLRLFELFSELSEIVGVMRASARSIFVFFVLVIVVVVVFACLLYVVEGPENGFTSIPLSIYWAVVTITTVGYGDLIPQTAAGRTLASLGMLVGYSILAVPTAIITSKLWERLNKRPQTFLNWNCPVCARGQHALDAQFCKHCGAQLDAPDEARLSAMDKP